MKRLEYVPVALAGLLLGVLSVLLWAQLVLGAVDHGKKMKLCAAVFGVTQPPSATFNTQNVLNGVWQKALAQRIGYSEPYFPFAVRVRNQVEYSLLDVPASPNVVIGAHQQLIQSAYIDDFCSRNVHKFLEGAPAWAAKIRTIQDTVEARGQTFLYVITPSKVAMYPQILPPGLQCPSSQADRTGLVPAWLAVVQKAGVHVVNTIDTLNAARPDYPFPMFPQGGIHWNSVGSALGTLAVEQNLQAQREDGMFKPFTFTWKMSGSPGGSDADLASVLNLMIVPTHFQVPDITIHEPPKAPGCHKLLITIVAGSFMEHVGPKLSLLPCGAHVVEYFYWHKHRTVWDNGVQRVDPIISTQRDDDLLRSDVVIYEENEEVLGRSIHGAEFYQWILQHPAVKQLH
jgi:alginate O-acetyltransferase complex protein AlgJ